MKNFEMDISYYKKKYHNLSFGSISNFQFRSISEAILLKRVINEVFTHMFYSLQFGINNYLLYYNVRNHVEVEIGGDLYKDIRSNTKEHISFSSWQVLFYLATILRNRNSVSILSHFSNEFLISENVTHDDLTVASVDILKSMDNSSVQEKIRTYWRLESFAKNPSVSRELFHFHLTTPSVRVLEGMLSGNNSFFNNELSKALQLHYDFYKSDRENYGMPGDPFGWISYKLLCICAIAHDRGMKIEVESDYLPMWMVKGDFQNCKLLVT